MILSQCNALHVVMCTGPGSMASRRAVQPTLRRVFRGDAHAGGRPHIHGLRHPHHLRLHPRLPASLEDRKVPHRQRERGSEGKLFMGKTQTHK